ncbi:MAG TPA: hypothetical protein VGF48_20250 [Thermoanaerobaculia bacterium]
MAIILPLSLTTPEIRVLQEFRRLATETLTLDQIKAIKHPAGGGEAPAAGLVGKGFLSADAGVATYSLTQQGKDFLAIDAVPLGEEGTAPSTDTEAAAE